LGGPALICLALFVLLFALAGQTVEVEDFYGAKFKPIDDIIAVNAAHNRMVKLLAKKLLAKESGAPLIDMTVGVDGVWDDDLFLDIVHFTERGNERVAERMFGALHFPTTTDGRTLILSRYTEPNVDQKLVLRQLGLASLVEKVGLAAAKKTAPLREASSFWLGPLDLMFLMKLNTKS